MNYFVFLYADKLSVNQERDSYGKNQTFVECCKRNMRAAIQARYGSNGFGIRYVLPAGGELSELFEVYTAEEILQFNTPLVLPQHLLGRLRSPRMIRVGGFHLNDCVTKFAEHASSFVGDVKVDVDLTERFFGLVERGEFRPKGGYDPSASMPQWMKDRFDERLRVMPWLVNTV